jgi:cellulose synthase/poly-beta-1,6-N-acetylglucosamine synthase-like glycosyltransferase
VLFMDGDAITRPDWPGVALDFLADHPKAALVHGQTLEEAPDASIYNWLTDLEWRSPVSDRASGVGRFVIRAQVFAQSGGFRDDMIAAEDDELFLRIRAMGWQTWVLDAPMCTHDINMHRFGPWYRRAIRAGHSFEELAHLHPGTARAQRRRALFWAGGLPVLALVLAMVWPPLVLGVLALYAASVARLSLRYRAMGLAWGWAMQAAGLMLVSKFANLYGMGTFWARRLRRKRAQIIEYK